MGMETHEPSDLPYGLRIMPMAEEDLDGIFDYIANTLEAPVAAHRLMAKVEKAIQGLKDTPRIGSKCRDETLNKKGYRKLIVGNYIAFYLVNDEERTVIVMRVIYGRRNYPALL
ncbi:translation repressor RelE [Spirochaetia bacterium]|nr:translation repressor RelE [Spirochaetia bacterium]